MSTPADTRERVLEAALSCIEREGLAATSVEDVARAASVSRATIYRHFPGGREQLVTETATWEVARFFARVEQTVAVRARPRRPPAPRPVVGPPGPRRPRPAPPAAAHRARGRAHRAVGGHRPGARADHRLPGRPAGGRAGRRPGAARSRRSEAADHLGRLYLRTSAPPAAGTSTTPPRSTASCAPSSWPASPPADRLSHPRPPKLAHVVQPAEAGEPAFGGESPLAMR